MRPTAVLDRHHLPVSLDHFVAADPETGLQRTGQRQEEPASAAVARRLLGHRAVRAVAAGVPALSGVQPAEPGQHPDPAQAELEGHLLDLRIVGEQVGRRQPGVIGGGRQ